MTFTPGFAQLFTVQQREVQGILGGSSGEEGHIYLLPFLYLIQPVKWGLFFTNSHRDIQRRKENGIFNSSSAF